MSHPDTGLFRWINQWPQSLGPTMRFLSEAANHVWVKVILGLLVVAMLWGGPKSRRTVIQALLAVCLANGLTDLFKALHPEHRPFQELTNPAVTMWVGTSPSHGTASAHAANMAAVAFVFVWHLRWWGAPWVAIAILVGISRVFCGAHYPHQVALGWLCGIAAGLVITNGWELIRRRSKAS